MYVFLAAHTDGSLILTSFPHRQDLYRRALLLREAEISEKRAKLKASLATGKPLDPSIANDKGLRKDLAYDESQPDTVDLDLDDEYQALSGIVEPRVLVTTARDPSSRLSSFSKEVRKSCLAQQAHEACHAN